MLIMASQLVFFAHVFLVFLIHSYIVSSQKNPSNMKFLKTLSGVQKGDNIKGVDELKKYLTYLGYSNHNNCSNNEKHQNNNNIFDDPLEIALKTYQNFYHLNTTGVLDPNTISKMHEPRCGMPDFDNHNCNNIPFLTTSLYTFVPGRPRWKKRKLKYAFSGSTPKEAILPFEHALKDWAYVASFKFERVRKFSGANIQISFLHGNHGDNLPFGGPDPIGGVAHSFPAPDGRVHFDAAQKWSNKGEQNAFDIKTVGLHELGHVLGLGHSSDENAVMYPIVSPGKIKKLHDDDIKGVKALYKLK